MTEKEWNDLLAIARQVTVTSEDREAQRRSFAYGNTNLSNPNITREIVDTAAMRVNR